MERSFIIHSEDKHEKFFQDKKTQSICEQQDLSNFSFEERMKLYKEKYGQQSNVSSSSKKNDKKTTKKQSKKSVTNSTKTTEKLSLLDRIKKFFGR